MEFRAHASSSDGNFYSLHDGDASLAIECGIRFAEMQKYLKFKASALSGIIISHAHGDHAKGAKDAMSVGIDCYMGAECAERLGCEKHHRYHEIRDKEQFSVGTFSVMPFEVCHDEQTFGFVVLGPSGRKVFYLTDTAYAPNRFNDCHILAIEANWGEDEMRASSREGRVDGRRFSRTAASHMSIERLIRMLGKNDLAKVTEIHLLHLSDDNSDETRFKEEVMRATGKVVHVAPKRA